MLYRLIIPKKVQKDIRKIDKHHHKRLIAALRSLSADPYIGKKLEGNYKGQMSYSIWPYRIIYEIHFKESVILIIRIGHRQGVYK